MTTEYHAKLFAHELSRRHSASDSEKLASTLLDAQVDLNPHQVEAALFAFKSPFSKGAILADEVGLGKTIEAGLLLSQKWTEGKRRILIIGPANLRKQWSQEIEEKFFLPTTILEAKNYNALIKKGKSRPFEQKSIVICSFQFAARHADEIMMVPWDLAVIDEAHRLRNVYRTDNKIGKALKEALSNTPKVLLTATPLQNSLMELYGLVSIIDDFAFGDAKSFKAQYARLVGDRQFSELKARLKPICHRTLRRQVLEYIRYTNRIPITQEFTPTEEEQILYEMVSDYLRRPSLNALPSSQRTLMTLIMRKLLASSTFAIAGALDSLARKLDRKLKEDSELRDNLDMLEVDEEQISDDIDALEEEIEEWEDDGLEQELLTNEDIEAITAEINDLRAFRDLAVSISENAKGAALLQALEAGFRKAAELDAPKKVIIFTESRRTQDYLNDLLEAQGYEGKIVLFNGSNADAGSKKIYEEWREANKDSDKVTGSRTADMRAALVDRFRNHAEIMIATEAAAEGINLQFCSIVVNYDLPWNPQRIEQRIGRCHRYGQKHDVVVINFLNKNNAADQRVYELLAEKFQLFSGVFGASDEVLGAVESGVEFEKRVNEIYQNCRSSDEIETAFKALQEEMSERIDETMQDTRRKLLENFDAEVHDRLKINLDEARDYVNRYERMLWSLTKYEFQDIATFDDAYLQFILNQAPHGIAVPRGNYHLTKKAIDGHRYRLGHPLAQYAVSRALERKFDGAHLLFDYSSWKQKATAIEPFVGISGVLTVAKVSISGIDSQDHTVYSGVTTSGDVLPELAAKRLFELPCIKRVAEDALRPSAVEDGLHREKERILSGFREQRSAWLSEETQKLDKWADDKVTAAEKELVDVKNKVKELKREARTAPDPAAAHQLQKSIQGLEKKKRRLRQRIFEVEDEIFQRRDEMIAEIEARLKEDVELEELFTIKWTIN